MRIEKVVFKNFKSYVDETVFEFKNDKHINIIFGKNGNGKTSFIEGISLAFYGCKIFHSDHFTNDYIEFVTSRFSHGGKGKQIRITVEFIDGGEKYSLTRIIEIDKNKIADDSLSILKNGVKVDSCPFIQRYNYHVVEQLFLDGEEINDLIKNNKIKQYIDSFIDTAFNIRTFEKIKSDLKELTNEEVKDVQTKRHKHIEEETKALTKEVDILSKDIEKIKQNLFALSQQNENYEKELDRRDILSNVKTLKKIEEKEQVFAERKDKYTELKNLLLNDIQLLMQKSILNQVTKKLENTREDRVEKIINLYNLLSTKNVNLENNIEISLDLELETFKNNHLTKEISSKEILNFLEDLKKIDNKYKRIVTTLKKTNDGQKHLDITEDHEANSTLVSKLKKKLDEYQLKQQEKVMELNNKQSELDKCNDEILKNKISKNAMDERDKLNKIVSRYISEKKRSIYSEISKRSVELLNKYFLRKNALIDEVVINESVFKVLNEKIEVNYNNFSAGEKQILAVSIIFSIIELSNLKLPLVLDSFVGRLDKEHTENILEYLRLKEQLQIILLSTDNEMNYERITMLGDKLGNCYVLENDGYNTKVGEIVYENKNE